MQIIWRRARDKITAKSRLSIKMDSNGMKNKLNVDKSKTGRKECLSNINIVIFHKCNMY